MKTPEELVVTGPYKYVRNPVYISLFFTLLGFTILLDSPWLLVAASALMIAIDRPVVGKGEAA